MRKVKINDDLSSVYKLCIGLIFFQIADLLLVFITGPMEIMHYLAYEFVNSGSCKIAEYSRVLSGVASILNLLAVTTER